uniref:polysaccharide biosynthesis/export family protein n=1 Tax=uncultured Sphingomonas sp. TaxID=158754 RepID=UPI0025D8CC30|nr:polysaccharide biosynthesis/export family protein [uncultured Sphingomonas sp.]
MTERFGSLLVPAVLLAALGGGCSEGRGGPIPYNAPLAAPDAPTIVPLGSSYRIAPMDTVSVKVFKLPDLSGDYEVDLTGRIAMPLIGSVAAAELTTSQLDQALTEAYGTKYLENPDISVGVKASTRRSVTVDGSVKNSGSFPVTGPVTLIQAVALAGGTGDDANPRRVAVFRTVGGKRQAAAFDLTAIRRGQAEDPQIYPGDIVVVDGSSIKATQKSILNSLPIFSIFRPF